MRLENEVLERRLATFSKNAVNHNHTHSGITVSNVTDFDDAEEENDEFVLEEY